MKNIIKALIWELLKLLIDQIISCNHLPSFTTNIICNMLYPYYNILFELAYSKIKMLHPILKNEIKYILERIV